MTTLRPLRLRNSCLTPWGGAVCVPPPQGLPLLDAELKGTHPMTEAPQDRKAKKGHVRIGGKDYKVRPGLDDDWSFVEMQAAAEKGSPAAMIRSVQYALNDDDAAYEAVKEQCRGEDGQVSATQIGQWIERILGATVPNS